MHFTRGSGLPEKHNEEREKHEAWGYKQGNGYNDGSWNLNRKEARTWRGVKHSKKAVIWVLVWATQFLQKGTKESEEMKSSTWRVTELKLRFWRRSYKECNTTTRRNGWWRMMKARWLKEWKSWTWETGIVEGSWRLIEKSLKNHERSSCLDDTKPGANTMKEKKECCWGPKMARWQVQERGDVAGGGVHHSWCGGCFREQEENGLDVKMWRKEDLSRRHALRTKRKDA